MKIPIRFLAAFLPILAGVPQGCTKNDLIIEDFRGNGSGGDTASGTQVIHFYPRVGGYGGGGSLNMTPFPEGCRVQAFAFTQGIQLTQWAYYQSLSAGTLSPLDEPLLLAQGTYDIYLVSTKSSADPPVFHQGKATALTNGVDYLWYGLRASVLRNTTNIPVNFTHSMSQLVINVTNAPGEQVAEWIQYAMMGAPALTATTGWDLYNGKIAPTGVVRGDSLIVMAASGLTCQQIILPIEGVTDLYVYLNMKIAGENEYRGYPLSLPLPSGRFMGGYSYHYDVEFMKDSVYVNPVNIASWIEVDEEGQPLYPDIEN